VSHLLGVDAGQTVTKAVVVDAHGTTLGTGRVDTLASSPRPGWHERDMTAAWRDAGAAMAAALRASGLAPDDVAAVGLCGHGDGVYAVDAAGTPVRPAILATDSRARGYAAGYHDDGTAEAALALTGQSPSACSPASLCAWLRDNEPATLDRARWLLFAKDWLRLCLTGEVATDPSDASASFTEVATQRWSPAALALFGLDRLADRLPPMRAPAAVAGHVTDEAAAVTGLAAGTPVVTGTHDVDAAAVGLGAVADGAASVLMGTFAINQVVASDVRRDHRWLARSFLAPDRWLHMSTSPSSASNLDWAVRLLGPFDPTGRPDVAAAVAAGSAVDPAGAPLFLPFLYSTGAVFAGVRSEHGRDDLLRAVLDGVAFSHRTHLDALRSAFPLSVARLGGGGARSPRWCQLLADASGLDLEVTDADEAGARGAALLAGVGAGWWASVEEAVAATVTVTRRHAARPSPVLEDRYAAYRAAVAALAPSGS
jgi:L-xylulokinase